jgi:hypothetical protein
MIPIRISGVARVWLSVGVTLDEQAVWQHLQLSREQIEKRDTVLA